MKTTKLLVGVSVALLGTLSGACGGSGDDSTASGGNALSGPGQPPAAAAKKTPAAAGPSSASSSQSGTTVAGTYASTYFLLSADGTGETDLAGHRGPIMHFKWNRTTKNIAFTDFVDGNSQSSDCTMSFESTGPAATVTTLSGSCGIDDGSFVQTSTGTGATSEPVAGTYASTYFLLSADGTGETDQAGRGPIMHFKWNRTTKNIAFTDFVDGNNQSSDCTMSFESTGPAATVTTLSGTCGIDDGPYVQNP